MTGLMPGCGLFFHIESANRGFEESGLSPPGAFSSDNCEPQRLKPQVVDALYGAAEAAPFQSERDFAISHHAYAWAGDVAGLRVLAPHDGGVSKTDDSLILNHGPTVGCGLIFGERHWNVNVFEEMARGDAANSITEFDQVVAFAAAMFAAEAVGEAEVAV
jgi:hypothetical protein